MGSFAFALKEMGMVGASCGKEWIGLQEKRLWVFVKMSVCNIYAIFWYITCCVGVDKRKKKQHMV